MTKVIPSLSEHGWVTDSSKVLNYLLSYYILTDNGQSLTFQDNLINLPLTYYEHINDPDAMAAGIKSDLDRLLSRYFDMIEVQTEARKIDESRYGVLLYASVVDENSRRVDLSKVVEINTTGLRRVIDINNYGDGIATLGQLV